MRHAIIILAHKNIKQVVRLVKYFEHNCYVIVHIDKKQIVDTECLAELKYLPQVVSVSRQYDVNWGGFSVLECELGMLRQAVDQTNADFFHLISGQDYPVRSLDFFLDFFKKNRDKDYLQYTHLPHPCWENNTFRRFQYYYPYDYVGNRPNPRMWVWELVKKQQ